ncbi:MAG: DUF1573 domain-containing protein [Syntrophobacteraceae bacterium]
MKRLVVITACVLACFLVAGCAHVSDSSSKYLDNFLAQLKLGKPPAQNPEKPQICILDPVAYASETADKPVAAAGGSPAVVVPETSHDFGRICEGKDFTHRFSIKNTGESVLNIKKVVPG